MSDNLAKVLTDLESQLDAQNAKLKDAIAKLKSTDNNDEKADLLSEISKLFENQGSLLSIVPALTRLSGDGLAGKLPLGRIGLFTTLLSELLGTSTQPGTSGNGVSPQSLEDLLSKLAEAEGGGGDVKPQPGKSSAPEAEKILAIAKRHLGQNYNFNRVDYTDPHWKGSFDCAEYASYCAWRAYGILYGVRLDPGTGDQPNGMNVEGYTGFWKADAHSKGIIISKSEALRTAGAFLLRYPPGDGRMGHIAISLGDGKHVYEAHSRNRGVIKNSASGRVWNVGIKLPGVDYGSGVESPIGENIYRYVEPIPPYDEVVELIQKALHKLGLLSEKDIDGEFGPVTRDAVLVFQRVRGLVEDGEVGPETGAALGLGKIWEEEGPSDETGETDDDETSPKPTIPSPLSTSKKFPDLRPEYRALYEAAIIREGKWRRETEKAARSLLENKDRYESVAGQLGAVPWHFVAIVHNLESTRNFNTHLHNGDSLARRTVQVPKGRPRHKPKYGERYTWEESALDALKMKKFHVLPDWGLEEMLYRFEKYNGFGYRKRGVPSAYLWSGTNIYDKGKFVADGVWSPTARSKQVGAATLLKAFEEMGEIKLT